MSPEKQRIAIAESCEIDVNTRTVCRSCNGNTPYEAGDDYGITLWRECKRCNNTGKVEPYYVGIPDYLNDRNAIHDAIETLRTKDGPAWFDFQKHLMDICGSVMNCIQASPTMLAEAFLKTIGKWEEDEL